MIEIDFEKEMDELTQYFISRDIPAREAAHIMAKLIINVSDSAGIDEKEEIIE